MKATTPSRRRSTSIPNSRWAAYATAGAATAFVGASFAEATIIYSGPLNVHFDAQPGPPPGSIHYFPLDQAGDSFAMQHVRRSPDPALGSALFGIIGKVSAGVAGSQTFVNGENYVYVAKLGFGQRVSLQPFVQNNGSVNGYLAAGSGFPNSQWLSKGTGFIGFDFNGGNGLQYGWARVNMDSGAPGNTFTLVDYAFGTAGQSITTGQESVPDSGGSLGLLALGSAGLLAWRAARSREAKAS